MSLLTSCILVVLISVVAANFQRGDVRYYLTTASTSLLQIPLDTPGKFYPLDPSKDVKVICHGWLDNINSRWYAPLTSQYLIKGNANVIAIDWSRFANGLYNSAANAVPAVGDDVATTIISLSGTFNISLSRFHLIGHSLGAQIFGFTGQQILSRTGQLIGRITGLDPAGPSFAGADPSRRLSPDDATFVDVIHTDAGISGIGGVVGDVDFYPNGGTFNQNGCRILDISCSHNRAPIYFYESVNTNAFVAVACDSTSNFNNGRCNGNQRISMGENVDTSARGTFYLRTASSSPFALG